MSSPDAVDQVKARLDILEVVGGRVSLHRQGRQHVGLCPFHAEKTPSFSVSQEKQSWYCHGCHEGGDIFTFVEKIERVDFARALELLAERAGVELERDPRAAGRGARRRRTLELNARSTRYYEYVLWNLPGGEPGRRLLTERGVADEVAHRFQVGFAPAGGPRGDALVRYLVAHGATLAEIVTAGLAGPTGRDLFRDRLVFPIADERGQVLGFGARALGDARPKYLNTPDTSVYHKTSALFGLDQARDTLRERRVAVVVEGYFDVIAAHSAGVANTVAASGTALTREQLRVLARHADQVVLCFDGDAAGRAAAARAVELCDAEGLPARIAVMPPGVKDPDEMCRRDPAGFAALVAGASPEWLVLLDWRMGEVGSSAEERRAAGDRAIELLRRIPDPAVREPYVREAMRRLELWEGSDFPRRVAQAAAAWSRGGRRPEGAAGPAPPASAQPPGEGGDAAEPSGGDGTAPAGGSGAADPDPRPPSWEEYLVAFAVQRPELAGVMVEQMGLDLAELSSPAARRLVELALASPPGAALALHLLSAPDRRLAASLAVRDIPELGPLPDPVALQRAISDCIARVGAAARNRRARREIHELLPAVSDPAREQEAARRIREVIAEQRRPSG